MSNPKNPFFSVVVPTFERADDLSKCLFSLSYENQDGAPPFEIIVSDDSKTDNCKKLVENDFSDAKWGKGKKIGPAGNRNAGVARANGKWIVFLDDDCVAQYGYLVAYANAIKKHPKTLVFEGRIYADRPRKTWAEGCPENENGGMFWTSNLCVNKELYLELGGLDERFKVAYEDVEFAYRIKQKKLSTVFVSDAAVCHPWRTLRKQIKNWKQMDYQWDSLRLFLEKQPSAKSEYGNPGLYLRHAWRMVTKDLFFCIFKLKGKGIDILFKHFFCSLEISIRIFFLK
tara:strand:+ start:7959 stop:8816 length:858 start_codon:yes stop_codon:yes gene_type:complete